METPKKTSFTYKLSDEQQSKLVEILRKDNYRPFQVQYSIVAGETNDCKIILYQSGKCLVQGRGAEEFVMFVLEPNVLGRAETGYEELLSPEVYSPHMGVDESGKGDFFGPLVIAGVFTDAELSRKLLKMGVKDSKSISSDKKAIQLADDIKKLTFRRHTVVMIGPPSYNRLYSKMRNVNKILAWAHARVIENLLELVPECPMAVSDQFGSKEVVERALMSKGREIKLVQRHRAESDVAVAAASILARAAFLNGLKRLGSEHEISLSKGASSKVVEDGKKLIEKHGPKVLLNTAKCHFKTADVVLKSLSLDRGELGAEGQAVSKPVSRSTFRSKP